MPWMTLESFVKLVKTQAGFEEHVEAGLEMMDKIDKGEVAPPEDKDFQEKNCNKGFRRQGWYEAKSPFHDEGSGHCCLEQGT